MEKIKSEIQRMSTKEKVDLLNWLLVEGNIDYDLSASYGAIGSVGRVYYDKDDEKIVLQTNIMTG